MTLDYAIVVATRNRLSMLRASVPLFLDQSRPPARIVIVDHSDDHGAVAAWRAEMARTTTIPIELVHADRANSAHQRNLGIMRVSEPVTMLPDDDTLWFPDTAERMMAVYERDPAGLIGGVTGFTTGQSPLVRDDTPPKAQSLVHRPAIERWRTRIEEYFAPKPHDLYGRLRIDALLPAARKRDLEDLLFVETMPGWRMSYRTAPVRRASFDATLGSRAGYALFEDTDTALRVQKAGFLLAAAPGARLMHNVAPGKRTGGVAYGLSSILNYAYMCRKVFGDTPPGRRSVERFLRYKLLLYRLRRRTPHDRAIARGAAAAFARFDRLWQTPDDRLAETYGTIWDEVMTGEA